MGLTAESTGKNAIDLGLEIEKETEDDRVVALAGNPNVGKSTVFNTLTGLNQHTGNWPGKTVASARGKYMYRGTNYILVDLPGTYSLMAHSTEEEVARDFICFGGADVTVVVCDATCLERNLNLVLQAIEITGRVVVCVNLMDEARKKNIRIDLAQLEKNLGVPVVATNARKGEGLEKLKDKIELMQKGPSIPPMRIRYTRAIEEAVGILEPVVSERLKSGEKTPSARWVALKLLEGDESLTGTLEKSLKLPLTEDGEILEKLREARQSLKEDGVSQSRLRDNIVSCLVLQAESVCADAVFFEKKDYNAADRKLDRILTSRRTGIPLMLALLCLVFWLTITGANYPSQMLSSLFFWLEDRITGFFVWAQAPEWLHGMLVLGVYRVLGWVISVMLPPMAIFFPLFTLLEDFGYLPRVAFNLDKHFKKCCACGKQALTMCMGFGCNAAGITGCRIIDSPRERLIAVITNNFVPCNGRFPTLVAIITMFFVGTAAGPLQSFWSAAALTGVILLGVFMTFLVSGLLSRTILKGVPSSFTLELPPYRRPQIGQVIVRSVFDRTLFVLGRAVVVAAPAGLVIWLLANITVDGATLLAHCSAFLDPFARLLGMDGVILMAFILGFPANEIVVPIIIMAYLANGTISDLDSLSQLRQLLTENGWTPLTAVCTMLFSLMHWPCSTTCLTIKKETQSLKWTAVSFAVPTAIGITVCFLVASVSRIFGLA